MSTSDNDNAKRSINRVYSSGLTLPPAKYRRIANCRKSKRVPVPTEEITTTTAESSNKPTLPGGFPPPPPGYEHLFSSWGATWRKFHKTEDASGKLQTKLIEFKEAANIIQNWILGIQRNAITNLHLSIAMASQKLLEEDIIILENEKVPNNARIQRLERLIGRLTARVTRKEDEFKETLSTFDMARSNKKLKKARRAVQKLLCAPKTSCHYQ
ncbi:hypothetical protein H4R24_002178 [Coemansia sp. RSA 988]|nr:hypothetical protein H4R24_002178 [Coemansia sp. RSA 988]